MNAVMTEMGRRARHLVTEHRKRGDRNWAASKAENTRASLRADQIAMRELAPAQHPSVEAQRPWISFTRFRRAKHHRSLRSTF